MLLYKLVKIGLIFSRNRSSNVIIGKLIINIIRNKAQIKWRVTIGIFRYRRYLDLRVYYRLFIIILRLSLAAISV